jgi:exopolysaccharide biosynthesis protein
MMNHGIVPRLRQRILAGDKKLLGSWLSFALLASGLVGVSAIGDLTTGEHASSTTLAASQDTQIGTYSNSKARITVKKRVSGSGEDTVVSFIADVTLTEGTALRSAFANNSFSRTSTQNVSAMAKANKAVLAINGDYSSFRMNGIIVSNGVSYLDKGKRQGLAFLRDGSAKVYDETTTTAPALVAENVWQTQSFGPGLVVDGKIPSGIDTYEIDDFGDVSPGAPGSIQGLNPRTGIGFIEKNHLIMIVVDGRKANNSRGATMPEFAQMFVDAGAKLAYNLDGGASETMYFNGITVNKPSDGAERPTSNILYIAK